MQSKKMEVAITPVPHLQLTMLFLLLIHIQYMPYIVLITEKHGRNAVTKECAHTLSSHRLPNFHL